ncbi:hypothetical protein [Rhodoferax ferrireducens]|nr:hypothetical protein [Rhodoferax ferrireducens]
MPKKNIAPASTVDAPFLSKEQALNMPEYAQGNQARIDGIRMADCPYSITEVSRVAGRMMTSEEYRLEFENKFSAWIHGFKSN